MPSYFYHLSLEILPSPKSSQASSLVLESAWEALLPFQKRSGLSSSSPLPGPSDFQSSNQTSITNLTLDKRTQRPHISTSSYISTRTAKDTQADIRCGAIVIECIDMVAPEDGLAKRSSKHGSLSTTDENLVAAGIGTDILGGLRTKGRYIPLDQKVADSVFGIVHLYRDAQESPYLAGNEDDYPTYLKGSAAAARHPGERQAGYQPLMSGANTGQLRGRGKEASYPFPVTASASVEEEDCTTLCILAVPSYLSPSDFLGFVGDKTRDSVSHFRMIRTPRANRYMVLLKFRSAKKAKEWQKEWNGKVFNSMEPETCHVVFVKSVEIQVVEPGSPSAFSPNESSAGQSKLTGKPLAPPTPALIELPTCPVCLERMDETTGLLTIICQHVFHCMCLQKWKGSGCPVCRYTQDDFRKSGMAADGDQEPAECSVCHTEDNLWACLICGTVGCGRYDGAHAFDHWKATAHAFAIDLNSQRVWDYVGDAYVHRIIQSKSDGKLVELPAADHSALDPPDWGDAVPREKLENMSVEYTHLLTSQLESQRAYFEEVVERAADKASQASAAAAAAEEAAMAASARLIEMQTRFETLSSETIPSLERDRTRLEKRADKFEAMARAMEKDYREEKTINQSLMERLEILTSENRTLKAEKTDLEEQNRDLTFFISGSQRLQGQSDDIVQGTVSVPEPEVKKKKNKGKGRK
ncbi:uncharacterized protein N7477_009412 [Penicillium maclennaniae]|uniref:uncharacterized protein n=1 Tax=Penicillium maclennaniae TaxID=1343394 RepID=UPI002540FEC8|nr:uncharacterized protein N7477_009412 [Penicillium maclennaniae]KAJ5661796.1 hypothetical protein N7477_009412 [Penicillium maclennaniae]